MSSAFQIHENIYSSLLYDDNFEVSESQKVNEALYILYQKVIRGLTKSFLIC